jgi:PhoH-like ATPase
MKKTYILDTNVYLTNANALYKFGNNDILVPFKVLEELDKFKRRLDSTGFNARALIKSLDALRENGKLNSGIRIGKGFGLLFVKSFDKTFSLPKELDVSLPDNEILALALTEQAESKRKIVVVSRDINMRVKCNAYGILAENYIDSPVVDKREHIYSGYVSHLVDDQTIDEFHKGKDICFEKDEGKFFPNQFIMLISNSNDKKTALCRFIGHGFPLRKIEDYKKGIWGIRPKNKEQQFALDILLDKNIPVISLIGTSGTGKTLLAVAAGLQQVIGEGATYKRLVVSRPIQPVGKDLGFLPGSKEEKLSPWLMPIQDNLQFLFNNDRATLDSYVEKGIIEMEALTYIRGRSITNAFIILDEAQNTSPLEIKTMITRVGEGTKIVITGDYEQIDSPILNELTNGLTVVVEKFKEQELAGHITLTKGERSKVATLAAKIL